MPEYTVENCPLQHDGKRYEIGDPVKMSEKAAERLLARGDLKPGKASTPPPVGQAEIVSAIKGLDPDNRDLWTGDDKPQVAALEAVLCRKITAKDRDEAWESINAENRGGE
ncbi:MAG: hypothetical protein OEY01_10715 [Desulfobulbaceae bacterium]|nr:hypothetical protein [Desulfobulbaceae bacterium]